MQEKRIRLTRLERMLQIGRVLYRLNGNAALSTHNIAFWIGLRPSGHVRTLLDEMETLGWIKSHGKEHRPGLVKKMYQITDAGKLFIGAEVQQELPF